MKRNTPDSWAEGLSKASLKRWIEANEELFGEEVYLANEELKRRYGNAQRRFLTGGRLSEH
jgi:hypothetical protein